MIIQQSNFKMDSIMIKNIIVKKYITEIKVYQL